MEDKDIEAWLDKVLPMHKTLTKTVVNIIESLLDVNQIEYLTVTGRTKNREDAKEKIKRKLYTKPDEQMTDLSGIRIIAFFESEVDEISSLIEDAFHVDKKNSLSKDSLLATDQIGYRSIHYVCDLGKNRILLPEFNSLKGLKFEFQIRTVLQHAWAELAHDRNYKFSGKLPKEIERKLFLYAGMLEIADKGFDELSTQIDQYIEEFKNRSSEGDFNIEINSITLEEFVENWANTTGFQIRENLHKSDYSELVNELNEMGIKKISELIEIIPANFIKVAKQKTYVTTIHGLIRDWMIIHDYRKYHDEVSFDWSGFGHKSLEILESFLNKEQMTDFLEIYSDHDFFEIGDEFME